MGTTRARQKLRLRTLPLLAGLAGIAVGAIGCTTPAAVVVPRPAPPSPSALPRTELTPAPGVAGDPANGARLAVERGCGGCHVIGGLPGATGVAGPELTNVTLRPTLAGETIPMTPANLTQWLINPASVKPDARMPAVGLTGQEAQDIAAFLYSQPYNASR